MNRSRFLSVNFHLYKSCNEKCRYCFATFPEVRSRLTDEDAERLVRLLRTVGTEKLTFVGGEPTLHPALPRLLRVAAQLGLTTAIVSNGARLRSVLDECPDAVSWVALSVDSADEVIQRELGRGEGGYVGKSVEIFDDVRARGIRTKLNTVVTSLNWHEDMTAFVRRVRPERWKVFQVLPVGGQNDGSVEPLLITREQFAAFVDRHASLGASGMAPIAEDNEAMTGSYLMIDPLGRFFDNVEGRQRFSRPILDVGLDVALADVQFSLVRLANRGGIYEW